MSSFDKLFRPAGPLGGQQLSARQLREIAADAGAAQANDIPGGGFTRTQSGTVYDVPEAVVNEGSLTVEEVDGSPSYTSVGTLRFDQADGFVISQPSASVVKVKMTAPTSTVTIGEVDGSPSFSASQIQFDQSDGFVVTNPSAGVARIDISAAGSGTAGVITTGVQTIAGVKTFQDGIEVDVDLHAAGTSTFDDTVTLNGADLISSGERFEMQSATATVDFTNIAAFLLPQAPPASSSDTGTTGQFTFDSDYLYIATGTNTWKRVALSAF